MTDSFGGYDALLVVSFGGPEGPDDVMPFLENVTRGRGVPRDRLELVAEHYLARGGVSPINAQVQALIDAIKRDHQRRDLDIPIYWGNRNWTPFLDDTVAQMAADGVQRAAAFVTSAYSSYSGCRQYRLDIQRAQVAAGAAAPQIDKLRVFSDHPGFLEPMIEATAEALRSIEDVSSRPHVLFTAHSIPTSLAATCDYQEQLRAASEVVASRVGAGRWDLVYQSRSGPPQVPWLEPDVVDAIASLSSDSSDPEQSVDGVVVVPIGFLSDHMEVLQDLDTDAAAAAAQAGLAFARAGTVGDDPRFAAMITDLVLERSSNVRIGGLTALPARPLDCAADCCPPPAARPARPAAS